MTDEQVAALNKAGGKDLVTAVDAIHEKIVWAIDKSGNKKQDLKSWTAFVAAMVAIIALITVVLNAGGWKKEVEMTCQSVVGSVTELKKTGSRTAIDNHSEIKVIKEQVITINDDIKEVKQAVNEQRVLSYEILREVKK